MRKDHCSSVSLWLPTDNHSIAPFKFPLSLNGMCGAIYNHVSVILIFHLNPMHKQNQRGWGSQGKTRCQSCKHICSPVHCFQSPSVQHYFIRWVYNTILSPRVYNTNIYPLSVQSGAVFQNHFQCKFIPLLACVQLLYLVILSCLSRLLQVTHKVLRLFLLSFLPFFCQGCSTTHPKKFHVLVLACRWDTQFFVHRRAGGSHERSPCGVCWLPSKAVPR